MTKQDTSSTTTSGLPIALTSSSSVSDNDCSWQQSTPPFFADSHRDYIVSLASKMSTSFEGALTEHLRMSGVYWSLTALSLLLPWEEVDRLMHVTSTTRNKSNDDTKNEECILDWLFSCWDPQTGGFGGNTGQNGHMLYTLSALQILALAGNSLETDSRLDRDRVIEFILALQQPDGSWAGDKWGEIDTRFTYCALSSLSLLNALDRVASMDQVADYILACRNLDGGFGCVIGAESHAGQVFTCIGALAIAQRLDRLQEDGIDLLGWWLAERQVDSGGLNGRPEKQSDVCYSWWILSSMSILNKVDWIHTDKLASFILKCQDDEDGGIADRPDDMADVFHTFFGISGLSLLGHLHQFSQFRKIDPIYALPTDVCQRLKLTGQVVVSQDDVVAPRLEQYQQCSLQKS